MIQAMHAFTHHSSQCLAFSSLLSHCHIYQHTNTARYFHDTGLLCNSLPHYTVGWMHLGITNGILVSKESTCGINWCKWAWFTYRSSLTDGAGTVQSSPSKLHVWKRHSSEWMPAVVTMTRFYARHLTQDQEQPSAPSSFSFLIT